MDTSGFYKKEVDDDNTVLYYAPNFVYSANYQLLREQYEDYQYPVDGWYWFNDRDTAKTVLAVPDDPYEELL